MWEEVEGFFEKYPAQKRVATFLFKRGFQVNAAGKVTSGQVEIPHAQIAKELGVDRRVVEGTARRIMTDQKMTKIFANLKSIAFLRDVAPELGLSVVIIVPDDASKPGIIGRVASKIAEHDLAIRQAISDDPFFVRDPKLTVIVDGQVTGELINELKKIDGVKGLTIF